MNRSPLHSISAEDIATYRRDGVVCLRGMLDRDWIERMQAAIAKVVADPLPFGIPGPSHGPMVSICYLSRQPGDFRDFVFDSPAAEIAGRVIGANAIRLYHDHLFVKPASSPKIMAWHCDETAWPVTGEMVPNIWTAFSPVNAENGRIEYVAGFHRHCIERGLHFGFRADQADGTCPNFELERLNPQFPFRIIAFDMDPGDCVVFHPFTPHFSTGNTSKTQARVGLAVRLFGDDVRWWNQPYKAKIPGLERIPGSGSPEGELFPVLWERARTVGGRS